MNKKLTSIIAAISLSIGFSSFAISQPINRTQEQINKDSPFGIHWGGPALLDLIPRQEWIMNQTNELGADWLRMNLMWQSIEQSEGRYDWSLPDSIVDYAEKAGVNLLLNIRGYSVPTKGDRKLRGKLLYPSGGEKKLAAYEKFMRELIRRYKGKVRYWQIENEVTGAYWSGSMDEYVQVLRTAYCIIKAEDGESRIIVAGFALGAQDVTGPDLLESQQAQQYLEKLQHILNNGKECFDIFDIHIYYSPESVPSRIDFFREQMKLAGYQKPIWITEMGGPDPRFYKGRIPQPHVHPSEVIKRYVLALSSGVERIFWHSLATPKKRRNIWSDMALIRDEERRPAYYAYKKMVEILEGSDWDNIQTIQESVGIYIYKFTKGGKSIWVAWNDNKEEREIVISGISSSQVKVTEAVPKYESGKEVEDYNAAFKAETKSAQEGKVTINLKEVPVFIERN